jgi:hypothetical protein
MEVITCSWGARSASASKSFIGNKTVIKAGGRKITLPDDVEKTKVTQEQKEMTGGRAFLIVLLAITVLGLVLAIPLYFAGKKKRMTMAIKTKTGDTLMVATDNNYEWGLLSKYAGLGTFD